MPKTDCPPGVWTVIPAVNGDMLLETRGIGGYVDTTGTAPTDVGEAIAMPSNDKMVIQQGLEVRFQPAQDIRTVTVISNPV